MTSTDIQPPLERYYDLNRLSEAGYETEITASPDDRAKLALWAEIKSVEKFAGHVALRRLGAGRFSYVARLEADIVQDCTVTLEPVPARIGLEFTRSLHLVPQVKKMVDFSGELSPAAGDDEVPEEIDSPRFDLAAPILEEFLLAIDPYPRAAGVEFEVPADPDDRAENPFAVLKGLKSQG